MNDDPNELARWQGEMETRIADNSRRLDGHNGSTRRIEQGIGEIKVTVAVLSTKVAIGSGVGALTGAGAVTLVLKLSGS